LAENTDHPINEACQYFILVESDDAGQVRDIRAESA
jgi:hypothetical protein